jgi:phospholipase/lecithinase/hemolysin
MKRGLLRAVSLILLGVALYSCATSVRYPNTSIPTRRIERVVVFGDSNVDNGNLLRLTGNKRPEPPNWNGRNSNGPNVAEYFAQDIGASLEDYAVSGATTGRSNIVTRIDPTLTAVADIGVLWEIDEFEKAGKKLGPADVVVIWAGSNDIFGIQRTNSAALQRQISAASENIGVALDRLHALGAQRFVVATRTPREKLGSDNDLNGVDLNAAIIDAVNKAAQRTGAKIILFDAYRSIQDMMTNPTRYGFTHVNELCVAVQECASDRFEDGQKIANAYVNWDAAHKTTRVHRLMAEQLTRMVE